MSCHLGDITPSTTFLTTAMALGVSKFAEWEFTTASIEWVLKLFVGGKSHFCAITNDDDDTVVNQDKRIIFSPCQLGTRFITSPCVTYIYFSCLMVKCFFICH